MNAIPKSKLDAIKQKSKQMAIKLFFDMSDTGLNKAIAANHTLDGVYDAIFKGRTLTPYPSAGQLQPLHPLGSELTLLRMLTESAALNEAMLIEQYDEGDVRPFPYTVTVEAGDPTSVIINWLDFELAMGLVIINNQGSPVVSLYVSDEGPLLHISPADEGLVLTPACPENYIEPAEAHDKLYKNPDSLIVR